MIYLVSADKFLFTNKIKQISIKESLEILAPLKVVGLDTETSGLNCWNDKLLLVQLGCKDFQVVIDCRTIDILNYKEYLESNRLFLFWNAKFDIKWFFNFGIVINSVYDGFTAEKLLYMNYPKGYVSFSLKTAGQNYLGIELDKSVRGKIIWSKVLTEDIVIYGAEDVAHLEDIKNEQYKKLEKKGLLTAVDIECRFIPPLAYTEWCGIKIDANKWKAKMASDEKKLKDAKKACDEWLIKNEPNSKYIFVDTQGDLFLGYNLEPQVSLNWDSPTQLVQLFEKYGIDCVDSKTGKKTVESKKIKPQADKCGLIPIYLEYKEAAKVTSTYGQNFLDQINPKNGRILSNFNALGTDTGRLSSGGKDCNVEYINFQNLPRDAETRECFVAEEGNKWISIDYNGEESFLMASIANDKAMLHELIYGDKDLHTLTAKIVFPEIPKDATTDEVKHKYKKLRQLAKSYEFCFNYKGNASTIKRNFGLTDEEANRIYNAYMNGFYGLKQYQSNKCKEWWDKGYIIISSLTGHKAFIHNWEELKETYKEFQTDGFWDSYRLIKQENPDDYTVKKVREFFKTKSDIDRNACNYEIQGTGAIIFKIATVNFWNWILKNNLFGVVKLCIPAHDEWNCEAPKEIAEEVASKLHECMVNTGKIFCTRCPLEAEISRLDDGSLPNYWLH